MSKKENKTFAVTTPTQETDWAWQLKPVPSQLTKREQFAMAAMQGLTTTYPCSDDNGIQHNANIAVKVADALIKELDK